MKQTIKQLREKFISDSESFLNEITKLRTLTNDHLNWKPSADKWSIAECVDHLAVTNKLYLDEVKNQLSLKQIKCDESKEIVKHKFFGKLIIKAVDPSNIKKTKTFKVFYPTLSNNDSSIIDKLIEIQEALIKTVTDSYNINFNKYIMSSPASRFIKENFSDVLEIIRLHNKRHLRQINNLISLSQFPD